MIHKWKFLIFMYNEGHGDFYFYPPDALNSETLKEVAPDAEMLFKNIPELNKVGILTVRKEEKNSFLEKMMLSLFQEGWELYLVEKTTYFFRKPI